MHIGPYELKNGLLLAPMAGVADKPFRQLCRSLGADLAVGEMVTADTALWASRKSVKRLDYELENVPVAAQIVGNDPQLMADAARKSVQLGVHIVDINMGCPAKKVCKKAAGSALMAHPEQVRAILSAVIQAVEIPVTLKIRTGIDPQQRNGLEIARIAEDCGIQALTVHGRTRACRFAGEAEYDSIREIKSSLSIPVIANGDVDGPVKAKKVLDQTGADALMIGRAARGRPWIFNQINQYLTTGQTAAEPDLVWKRQTVISHIKNIYEVYGENHGVRIARKHIAWYTSGHRDSSEFRQQFNKLATAQMQLQAIDHFYEQQYQHRGLAA